MTLSGRDVALLSAAIVPVIVVFFFFDAYPQPAGYYDFADVRTGFGIANFWNVASNALFLVFGVAGLYLVLKGEGLATLPEMRAAYIVLFAGIAITALGSGWFHLSPENDTLFWDRLPMTIAFMSLFATVIGEHVSARLGSALLWPLLLIGIASVVYWDYTESSGAGDLRLYGVVQFLPLILIPALLLSFRSAFNTINFFWVTIGLYILAKLLEHFDQQIFSFGGVISGHSLKHFAASLVPLVLILGMRHRTKVK